MKKINVIGLLFVMTFFVLASCGGDGTDKGKSNKPTLKNPKKETVKKETKAVSKKVEVEDENSIPTPPEHLEKAQSIIDEVSKADVAAVDAKKKFKNLCAICHGTKGNMEINGAKKLTQSKVTLQEAVAQVYHGKGLMTPFKGILTDAEIVAVSKYVEGFRK